MNPDHDRGWQMKDSNHNIRRKSRLLLQSRHVGSGTRTEASAQALCISFGSEDVFLDLAQVSVLGIIFETHRCAWGRLILMFSRVSHFCALILR